MIKAVTNISQLTKFLSSFDVEEVNTEDYEARHKGLKVIRDEVLEVLADLHEVKLQSGKWPHANIGIQLIANSPFIFTLK